MGSHCELTRINGPPPSPNMQMSMNSINTTPFISGHKQCWVRGKTLCGDLRISMQELVECISTYRVIGVVLNEVLNLTIRPIIDICGAVSGKPSENGGPGRSELEDRS